MDQISVEALLQERDEMINKKVGNHIAYRLKEGSLKVDEGGFFKKNRTVFLCPQFVIIANGSKDKDKIIDVVVLKNAQLEPDVCKNFSGKVFSFSLTTTLHGTVKNMTPPGIYHFTCTSLETRAEWLIEIRKAIENLEVRNFIIYVYICIYICFFFHTCICFFTLECQK